MTYGAINNSTISARSYNIESLLSELKLEYSICSSCEELDSTDIFRVADVKSASKGDLTFCSSDNVRKASDIISRSTSKVILCPRSLEGRIYPNSDTAQSLIFVENIKDFLSAAS